jgi:hypothetical protein
LRALDPSHEAGAPGLGLGLGGAALNEEGFLNGGGKARAEKIKSRSATSADVIFGNLEGSGACRKYGALMRRIAIALAFWAFLAGDGGARAADHNCHLLVDAIGGASLAAADKLADFTYADDAVAAERWAERNGDRVKTAPVEQ